MIFKRFKDLESNFSHYKEATNSEIQSLKKEIFFLKNPFIFKKGDKVQVRLKDKSCPVLRYTDSVQDDRVFIVTDYTQAEEEHSYFPSYYHSYEVVDDKFTKYFMRQESLILYIPKKEKKKK